MIRPHLELAQKIFHLESTMIISGRTLYDLLTQRPSMIKGYRRPATYAEAVSKETPLQPSSFDLTVGAIYVPGKQKRGDVASPLDRVSLQAGHTVLVETAETLDLQDEIAAFCFPPASISSRGLLMTNPGHIDPGYLGSLRFTIINMGQDSFDLRKGDKIATVLFVRLDKAASPSYRDLHETGAGRRVIPGDLASLSHDFLNVEGRAKRIAHRSALNLQTLAIAVPLVLGALALIVPVALEIFNGDSKVEELTNTVTRLEERMVAMDSLRALRAELRDLKAQVDSVR